MDNSLSFFISYKVYEILSKLDKYKNDNNIDNNNNNDKNKNKIDKINNIKTEINKLELKKIIKTDEEIYNNLIKIKNIDYHIYII